MIDPVQLACCRQQLIDAGVWLYSQGWSPATSSNYSIRLDQQCIAITVSGRHKGKLIPRDIMLVDLEGNPVNVSECGNRMIKSSAETLLHTVLYQEKPDINVVLHTHSVHATVLTRLLAEDTALILEGYELLKAIKGIETHNTRIEIPVFENTQDIPALAERTRILIRTADDFPAYLIRGHGLYTWGKTMEDCRRHIEALEFLFQCFIEERRLRK